MFHSIATLSTLNNSIIHLSCLGSLEMVAATSDVGGADSSRLNHVGIRWSVCSSSFVEIPLHDNIVVSS